MLGCYNYTYPYMNMMPMMAYMSQGVGTPIYNQSTNNNIQFTNRSGKNDTFETVAGITVGGLILGGLAAALTHNSKVGETVAKATAKTAAKATAQEAAEVASKCGFWKSFTGLFKRRSVDKVTNKHFKSIFKNIDEEHKIAQRALKERLKVYKKYPYHTMGILHPECRTSIVQDVTLGALRTEPSMSLSLWQKFKHSISNLRKRIIPTKIKEPEFKFITHKRRITDFEMLREVEKNTKAYQALFDKSAKSSSLEIATKTSSNAHSVAVSHPFTAHEKFMEYDKNIASRMKELRKRLRTSGKPGKQEIQRKIKLLEEERANHRANAVRHGVISA